MPFELRIALRYLLARRKQAFISVTSALSVLGVVVGVTALFVALGLMAGLQAAIRDKVLGATAHVSVFRADGGSLEDPVRVVDAVQRVPGVQGAAPAVYGKGMISSREDGVAATFKGLVPAAERTVTNIGSQVEGGELEALDGAGEGPPPILLGRGLASSLAVRVGEVVSVLSPEGGRSPLSSSPRVTRFRVAGMVRTGLHEFDSEWAYLPLESAQSLFGQPGRVTLVAVRAADIYDAQPLSGAIRAALGQDYVTNDWIQMNQGFFASLWLVKMAIGTTIGLIVMVAALSIVATLVLMVMEKHRDIAILVSMGASRAAVTRIFMLQGLITGAAGTLLGALLGWTACRVLDRFRLIQVPGEVYQVSFMSFTLLPGDAAVVVTGALLVCFLATLYPAYGASRLDPAEALRYE